MAHRKKVKDGPSLIERAKQRMNSSLLRIVDESIYTKEATTVDLDKDSFELYHKAYSEVAKQWPLKPIDFIVKFIKKRVINKKNIYKLKFADIGCGPEPMLKLKLPPKTKIKSFDLVSKHPDIIEANMINLPLESESIECAVFSLSLMANNLGQILLEAKRILKLNGSLVIVEVASRFEAKEKRFILNLENIGFHLLSTKPLPPNSFFIFFHFKKVDSSTNYKSCALKIKLKPCLYKPR